MAMHEMKTKSAHGRVPNKLIQLGGKRSQYKRDSSAGDSEVRGGEDITVSRV